MLYYHSISASVSGISTIYKLILLLMLFQISLLVTY